jgi:hypothetical protein
VAATTVVATALPHEGGKLVIDRALADAEISGDALAGAGRSVQDLALTRRQAVTAFNPRGGVGEPQDGVHHQLRQKVAAQFHLSQRRDGNCDRARQGYQNRYLQIVWTSRTWVDPGRC